MALNENREHVGTGLSARQQAVFDKLLKGKLGDKFKQERIPKRKVHSPVPLSFSQQRLWILDRLVPGNPFYNLSMDMRLTGKIDVHLIEQTLNEIIRRHESQRTIFGTVNDEPVQIILPELKIKIDMKDFQALSPGDRERETRRLMAEEAARPFNLSSGPLLRATLISLGRDEHVFLFTTHHIVSDTWSAEIFNREFAVIYDAFSQGKPSPLRDPALQYADFSVWQRGWFQGEVLQKQLSYWKGILGGELPIIELPADRQRPAVATYQGRVKPVDIPPDVFARLQELSRKEKCTMFMILLSLFNVLLHRYSGQEDIMIGSPIANRNRLEVEEMIGFFANTLVFRTDLSGDPTFSELLGRVRKVTSGAYDNQDLPFEKMVEEFQPDRYMSHTPLFQVMFVVQNVPVQKQAVASPAGDRGVGINDLPVHSGSAKFDLWLSLTELGDRINGAFEYSTDIFNDDTVDRLVGHFKNLVSASAGAPGQHIGDLAILSPAEKEQIVDQWNRTDRDYPLACLQDAFLEQTGKSPDQTALIGPGLDGDLAILTYSALNRKANQLAHDLDKRGVQTDVPVGICLERSIEMVIGLLGILKAGGAYLPLDPEYPRERLAFMVEDSAIVTLLTSRDTAAVLPQFGGQVVYLDSSDVSGSWEHLPGDGPGRNAGLDDLAYIIYTSGSTGWPKGAAVPHKGISNRLQWMQEALSITPSDRVLQKTPFSFDVSVWEFFWPLLFGAGLVMARPGGHKDSAYLVEAICRFRITTIHFVPTMLNAFLEDPGLSRIHSLKRVICSGEALPYEYQQRFFVHFPGTVELHNLYGPTEAAVDVTFWPCQRQTESRLVPIGRPIANTGIYILDRRHYPVPVGVHGEIFIGGIQLGRGYLNQPEMTAERFVGVDIPIGAGENVAERGTDERSFGSRSNCTPHLNLCGLGAAAIPGTGMLNRIAESPQFVKPQAKLSTVLAGSEGDWCESLAPDVRLYKTGDLARWLPDGSVDFLGRLDFQVKVRGFRIELGEIESALRKHPALQDAVVLARGNGAGGSDKKLVAYIVPQSHFWSSPGNESGTNLFTRQVSDWQGVFNDAYAGDAGQTDPTFNIVGWNSSYTGKPIPAQEMRLWVDHTVERILSLKPRRILEIGCGTGLFLFPLIPHCRYYIGTDISSQGLDYIQQQLTGLTASRQEAAGWAKVHLWQRSAENFSGLDREDLDLVILNSVVQYFPSIDYLLEVLSGASAVLRGGGHIFLGDVRSLPLLHAFHASVEFSRADATETRDQVNLRIKNRLALEQELMVDPGFFAALQTVIPGLDQVSLLVKQGRYENELSKFRYDVILRIKPPGKETGKIGKAAFRPARVIDRDWLKDRLDLSQVRKILKKNSSKALRITDVPNRRLGDDIRLLDWLAGDDGTAQVEVYRQLMENREQAGIEPQDFVDLGQEFPFHVSVRLPQSGVIGTYDVFFIPRKNGLFLPAGDREKEIEPWAQYANNPLIARASAELLPELRDFLKDRLPAYMVPSSFVLLPGLPLLPNGKLDRKALPEPLQLEKDRTRDFVEPRTDLEKFFAATWTAILNLDRIGIQQNFFELGGDSINAIRIISRINQQGFQLSIQDLYKNQTIEELARAAERQARPIDMAEEPGPTEDLLLTMDRQAIQKALPDGVEIEDIYPCSPLQRHMFNYLENHADKVVEPPVFIYQRIHDPIRANINLAVLERTMQTLTDLYPILRTMIYAQDLAEPVQVLCRNVKPIVVFRDLTGYKPDEKPQQLQEMMAEEWRHAVDRHHPVPLRMGVVRMEEDLFLYFLTCDYSRVDGWGTTFIYGYLGVCYQAMLTGRPFVPKTDNSYKSYLYHIKRLDKDKAREYWQSLFEGFPGPQPQVSRFVGNDAGHQTGFARQHCAVSRQVSAGIDGLLRRERLLFSALAQGLWALILCRYTGGHDVVFGFLTTGRSIASAGIDTMVGHAINILPVRLLVDPGLGLVDWLRQLLDRHMEWTQYEYTQIEWVYEWLGLDMGRPMFETIVVVQNLVRDNTGRGGQFTTKDDSMDSYHAKMEYPIRFDLYPGSVIQFQFNYYRRFTSDRVIRELLNNFKTLLQACAENPDQTIGQLMDLIQTESRIDKELLNKSVRRIQ